MRKLKQKSKPVDTPKSAYDEKSPITGNFSVLVETVKDPKGNDDLYKVCMDTGYQTYHGAWRSDNAEILAVIEKQMPEYVVAAKHTDNLGVVWYPMMTLSPYGMLHPVLDSHNQLKWAISDINPVESDNELDTEQIVRMPIQTEEGVRIGLFKVSEKPNDVWALDEFELAFGTYQDLVQEQLSELD